MKLCQFLLPDGKERGMQVGENLQFLVKHIANEFQAVGRIVVLNLSVDGIFVNPLAQQFADDDEEVGVIAVECEEACVGCHACIEVLCCRKA